MTLRVQRKINRPRRSRAMWSLTPIILTLSPRSEPSPDRQEVRKHFIPSPGMKVLKEWGALVAGLSGLVEPRTLKDSIRIFAKLGAAFGPLPSLRPTPATSAAQTL